MKASETSSLINNPTDLTVSKRGASTPRPWRTSSLAPSFVFAGVDCVAAVDTDLPKDVQAANARLIVRAVNAHDDMLAALKAAVELADRERPKFDYRTDECQEIYQQCKDAIAKAVGDRTAPAKTETGG